MRTKTITVTSQGEGMNEALALTEGLGTGRGLEKKEALHLRLLAEELLGLLRSVAGDVDARYWIEVEENVIELHMYSDVDLTDDMRRKFISASTSGSNEAAKGIMGRMRVMIAEALMPKTEEHGSASGLSLGLMSMAGTGQAAGANAYQWSLKKYKSEVESAGAGAGEEAWDELERSIIANVADEVSVSIVGTVVEIVVYKSF